MFLLLNLAVFSSKANGVQIPVDGGILKVSFVCADIVRVQFSPDGQFVGNNTGVCISRSNQKVSERLLQEKDWKSLFSDSLEVRVNAKGAVSFYDRSGQLLLSENISQPRRVQRRWIEKVSYDESSKAVVHTANGDVQQMQIARRDTIGSTWRYFLNFQWQKGEALYGLGSHGRLYEPSRQATLSLSA